MDAQPVLMAGRNLIQKNDRLTRISVDYLKKSIAAPKSEIASMITLLRNISTIDQQRYRELKKKLPYFVCAVFNPPFRRTENFAYSSCFILDFDHLHQKETTPQKVKERIKDDPHVLMMFISPGGDGLKMMFQIDRKITDPVQFMLLYKNFADTFSNKYGLTQVIDRHTADATRACFISYDPEVFFNASARPVIFDHWVDESDGYLPLAAKKLLKKGKPEQKDEAGVQEQKHENLTNELYAEIRKKLNPNARVAKPKQIYVPEEIEQITQRVIERFESFGLTVKQVQNIHYGRKFIFMHETHFAEVNVFYGKHGYTVVRSMKKGSNQELLETGFAILSEMFYGHPDINKKDG